MSNKFTLPHDEKLESSYEGFEFLLPQEVRDLVKNRDIGYDNIKIDNLFRVIMVALRSASSNINPLIGRIREGVSKSFENKGNGSDFFTVADSESELAIIKVLQEFFGDKFKIYAEESDQWEGNLNSPLYFLVDPIDGTRAFKMGQTQDWSIMIGAYLSTDLCDKQVLGVMYFPERRNLVYFVDGIQGVFILDIEKETTNHVLETKEWDKLSDVLVTIWEHTDRNKGGSFTIFKQAIESQEAHSLTSMSSASAAVLEAIQSEGRRILIIDGDMAMPDYIVFHVLYKFGYKFYTLEGVELDIFSKINGEQKLVAVPPGKAGEIIVELLVSSEIVKIK